MLKYSRTPQTLIPRLVPILARNELIVIVMFVVTSGQ